MITPLATQKSIIFQAKQKKSYYNIFFNKKHKNAIVNKVTMNDCLFLLDSNRICCLANSRENDIVYPPPDIQLL